MRRSSSTVKVPVIQVLANPRSATGETWMDLKPLQAFRDGRARERTAKLGRIKIACRQRVPDSANPRRARPRSTLSNASQSSVVERRTIQVQDLSPVRQPRRFELSLMSEMSPRGLGCCSPAGPATPPAPGRPATRPSGSSRACPPSCETQKSAMRLSKPCMSRPSTFDHGLSTKMAGHRWPARAPARCRHRPVPRAAVRPARAGIDSPPDPWGRRGFQLHAAIAQQLDHQGAAGGPIAEIPDGVRPRRAVQVEVQRLDQPVEIPREVASVCAEVDPEPEDLHRPRIETRARQR